MLSERWLIIKWIKHIAVQVGSMHLSHKGFLQPIINFQTKVFWSWFEPKHGYKTVKKRSQNRVNTGDCYQRELSCITFPTRPRLLTPYQPTPQSTYHTTKSLAFPPQDQDCWHPTNPHHNQHTTQPSPWHFHHKTKTADTLPTHTTINIPHNQVPGISTTRPRLLTPYQPTPQSTHHTTKSPSFPPQDQDCWHPTNPHHNQHTTQPSTWHFHHKTKTADTLPTHTTINTPHNQVPGISITKPRLLTPYQPTPQSTHHTTKSPSFPPQDQDQDLW